MDQNRWAPAVAVPASHGYGLLDTSTLQILSNGSSLISESRLISDVLRQQYPTFKRGSLAFATDVLPPSVTIVCLIQRSISGEFST